MSNSPRRAILLIAHGSRREEANDDLHRLAELVAAKQPDAIVEVAFLELAEPTIPDGVKCCIEKGASHVFMLPYFLSAGTHVKDDLQRFCEEFRQNNPKIAFQVCPPLGLHPLMVNIVIDRLEESMQQIDGNRD